jgi:hypothetical protein
MKPRRNINKIVLTLNSILLTGALALPSLAVMKYGVIDSKGAWIIPAKYQNIRWLGMRLKRMVARLLEFRNIGMSST